MRDWACPGGPARRAQRRATRHLHTARPPRTRRNLSDCRVKVLVPCECRPRNSRANGAPHAAEWRERKRDSTATHSKKRTTSTGPDLAQRMPGPASRQEMNCLPEALWLPELAGESCSYGCERGCCETQAQGDVQESRRSGSRSAHQGCLGGTRKKRIGISFTNKSTKSQSFINWPAISSLDSLGIRSTSNTTARGAANK